LSLFNKVSISNFIFFTTLVYGEMYHITTKQVFPWDTKTEILLVTGIANPRPLKKMLEEHSSSYHMLQYSDHHIFTIDNLSEIRQKFETIEIKQTAHNRD